MPKLEKPNRAYRLGTETAYAVALEAQKHRDEGHEVFPFHIGDLNFPTPDVVKEATVKAISDGKTGYCPAAGLPELRDALAKKVGMQRNVEYTRDNCAIVPGGKPVIQKFLLSVMEEGDEVLYPSPGYPIYESLINYFGGIARPYGYVDTGKDYAIDLNQIRSLVSHRTKAFILCNPSNPMASLSSEEELEAIAKICVENDLWVLSDEPYFDIVFPDSAHLRRSPVHLPGMLERTLILYTFSKSYAMTGWRIGAALGPRDLISHIVKLTTNFEACTTHFVQYGAIAALTHPECDVFIHDMMEELRERRDVLVDELRKVPGFSCHRPRATFYLVADVTEAMRLINSHDLEDFRRTVLEKTGVSFCTREHFGQCQGYDRRHYVRFAYSGIKEREIRDAISKLRDYFAPLALDDSLSS